MARWSVVVPTNRPDRFTAFMKAWKPILKDADIVVIHDTETVPDWALDYPVRHYAWDTIPLQHQARRSDMIRSWGIYLAWSADSDFTLTLDDDTLPNFWDIDMLDEYEKVFKTGVPVSDYFNVGALTSYGKPLRGFPFADRQPGDVAVQYGGWHGVLDYDAPTQLAGVRGYESFSSIVLPIPRGTPVTGCIMNCAWKTKYAPIMWQLPLVDGKYNRFGDIWSGLFQKRTLDLFGGAMVVNGKAAVRHERASDAISNLERETPGVRINETLWESLWTARPGSSLIETYRNVTDAAIPAFPRDYAKVFRAARDEWLTLF